MEKKSRGTFLSVLKRAFSMFDTANRGTIDREKVRTILTTLGHSYDDKELEQLLKDEDPEGENNLNNIGNKIIIKHSLFLKSYFKQDNPEVGSNSLQRGNCQIYFILFILHPSISILRF